jgi:photosystem II stability/assembly factor-like uncharacterized protein
VSGTHLWMTDDNFLSESLDGGTSWSRLPGVNLDGAFTTFDFVDPDHGWLYAYEGGLWRTTNGSTWSPEA